MKTRLPFIFIAILGLTSCGSLQHTEKKIAEIEIRKAILVDNQNTQNSKFIDAAKRALETIPEDNRTKEDNLALRLLTDSQKITGVPPKEDTFNVSALIKAEPSAIAELEKEEAKTENVKAEIKKLDAKEQELKDRAVTQAEDILRKEDNSLFGRIKDILAKAISYAFLASIVVIGLMLTIVGIKRRL